ncbi:MAG: hypothetical protein J6A19_05090 [Oscillospiraceae bacterium]|nr:hypothetical protein [Oscillospiraceae bacterium]
MSAISLDTAKKKLETWLEAEEALSTSQSYTVGTLTLTRADLGQVRKNIEFWEKKVTELERRGGRNRIYNVIPMD